MEVSSEKLIQGKAKCDYIVYSKNNFIVATFVFEDRIDGVPSSIKVVGEYYAKQGQTYEVAVVKDTESSYQDSYKAITVTANSDLLNATKSEVKDFLSLTLTKSQLDKLYSFTDNPIQMLEDEDVEKLTEVDGIGVSTAEKMIDSYLSSKDFSSAYIGLAKFGLTPKAITDICKYFKSGERAVEEVEKNPYILTKIKGFGFKRTDAIFLSNPDNKPNDPRRVEAYIDYMFLEVESEGHSYVTGREFAIKLKENIHNVDLKEAVEYVKKSNLYSVYKKGKEIRISTTYAILREIQIALHIKRLLGGSNEHGLNMFEQRRVIKQIEEIQGWNYGKEQMKAIQQIMKNNVFVMQGLAGTGKSSAVNAALSTASKASVSYDQCALSGKAAENLTSITNKQAYTIHSLLEYDPQKNGFSFNFDNKLPSDIVILDEVSMVNQDIFLDLIKAIKTGSKLVMIGDMGQLEAIGVGVMKGLVESGKIPMILLKEIHRQAKDSAIITHSMAIRNGKKSTELKLKADTVKTYGVKKDLDYILVGQDNENEIALHAMREFKKSLSDYSIKDIQILCSTKNSGVTSTFQLNKFAQRQNINVDDLSLRRIELGSGENKYTIFEGDKVINVENNKRTKAPDDTSRPIFNGNTGIVRSIELNEKGEEFLVIDFDGLGLVIVDRKSMNSIELGYAITIHKSQGSTIKRVILALPFHFMLNTRELLYTGITRTSEHCTIITSPRSFKKTVNNTSVITKKINLADFINGFDEYDFDRNISTRLAKVDFKNLETSISLLE